MDIGVLPNPKLANGRGAKPLWYRFYAMFSEDFATYAVNSAQLRPGAMVLDSWLGAGTTAAAATAAGHRVTGFDINPAMVVISAGRLLDRRAAERLTDSLCNARPLPLVVDDSDPLLKWFHRSSASELRTWMGLIASQYGDHSHQFEHGYASAALFETARRLAMSANSKNPTWTKIPERRQRIRVKRQDVRKLFFELLLKRQQLCAARRPLHRPVLRPGSSLSLNVPNRSVDLVLTSPPYCTRIDYAVSTAIELALLGLQDISLAQLRDASMGTSTIRDAIPPVRTTWGPTCTALLDIVRTHPSKSSHSYYLKTFLQYFSDLHLSLEETHRCLRRGGQAVFVVQDSLYKGIKIDLAQILIDMGAALGWHLNHCVHFPTLRSMRRVNTRSRNYHSTLDSSETVVWFRKP